MKVYVILENREHKWEYSYCQVHTVFSSEAKAKEFIENNPPFKDGYENVSYKCEEKEVL